MIFVTVGTHEQQFNRLIKEIDRLKKENIILDDIFIQIGFSDYLPQYCEYKEFLSYEEMEQYMKYASLVITHGGPSSFMKSLSMGKKTIIVPRLKEFDEHINNHQIEFLESIQENFNIDFITDITDIEKLIKKLFDATISEDNINNNNFVFCKKLEKVLGDLI